MHDLPEADFTQRFIFDDADVRGEAVALERSYAEVLAKHDYPLPVQLLLGEFMAAASLLVGTLKFDGLLILQARSEGPVPLLMIECSCDREIRGLARFHADRISDTDGLPELMPGGTLAMTIDPTEGQRYQGIVDLEGADLSASFSNYFALSEQLGTRFWLKAEELLGLDNETVLYRLYHEQALRLFDIQPIRFRCSCSRERSARALVSLGHDDARELLKEHGGTVEIDCQFCNQRYLFDATDVDQLFSGAGVDAPSDTRH
jgi:molecular chaperone Hsp33